MLVCNPFVRGFVPGILIGVFTSVLLFSLWRPSPLRTTSRIMGAMELGNLESNFHTVATRDDRLPGTEPKSLDECGMHHLETSPIPGAYLLLVLIHSHPANRALRQVIRATWISDQRFQSQYVARFVVGTDGLEREAMEKLACENRDHQDMLLLPEVRDKFPEWPTSEKLLSSFVWAANNSRFSFLFKCNDATFAVLSKITKFLQTQRLDASLLWGFFTGGVQATKEGKFGEKLWFLCNNYLPYPQGGGFVISLDLVEMLTSMAEDLEQYDHDDIAVGVWLSPFDGMKKQHDNRFNTGYYSRGCSNIYMVTHRESVQSMEEKFYHYKSSGKICSQEIQSRLSYIYNWTAPADRCCVRKAGIP